MNKIIDIDIIGDFQLEITYLDGQKGKLDLKRYNDNVVFKDIKKFPKFGLMPNGDIEWIGGVIITKEEILKKIIL